MLAKARFHVIIISILLFSCSSGISGRIVDNLGNPISKLNVKVSGLNQSVFTDENGQYTIDYIPGSFKLRFDKEGYVTKTKWLSVSSKESINLENIIVYKLPPEEGLFFSYEGAYLKVPYQKTKVQNNNYIHTEKYRPYSNIDVLKAVLKNTAYPNQLIVDTTDILSVSFNGKFLDLYTFGEGELLRLGDNGYVGQSYGQQDKVNCTLDFKLEKETFDISDNFNLIRVYKDQKYFGEYKDVVIGYSKSDEIKSWIVPQTKREISKEEILIAPFKLSLE